MRKTIPEQKFVYCDRCGKEIVGTPDASVRVAVADRDYRGDIVYGHDEIFEYCFNCAIEVLSFLKEKK